jgi:hypothetical protein
MFATIYNWILKKRVLHWVRKVNGPAEKIERGIPGNVVYCPLAETFRKNGDYDYIEVRLSRVAFGNATKNRYDFIDNPNYVEKFIRKVDDGQYKDLLK